MGSGSGDGLPDIPDIIGGPPPQIIKAMMDDMMGQLAGGPLGMPMP